MPKNTASDQDARIERIKAHYERAELTFFEMEEAIARVLAEPVSAPVSFPGTAERPPLLSQRAVEQSAPPFPAAPAFFPRWQPPAADEYRDDDLVWVLYGYGRVRPDEKGQIDHTEFLGGISVNPVPYKIVRKWREKGTVTVEVRPRMLPPPERRKWSDMIDLAKRFG